jgi:hypothetical protein
VLVRSAPYRTVTVRGDMENAGGGAAYYRARAAEMRAKADEVGTEEARASFLVLEASWLRLAETAEKSEADPDSEGTTAP